MSDEREDNKRDGKEIEFYAAKANAWFNTRLEKDKSLLVLSAGAIGLLVTLLTTIGVSSFGLLFLFIAAIISFIVCIFAVLAIFSQNARYLEKLIAGKSSDDPMLGFLDSLSRYSFTIGILLTSLIGLAIATTEVMKKETCMSNAKDVNQHSTKTKNEDILLKSFNGAQNLDPKTPNENAGTSGTTSGTTTSQTQSSSSSGPSTGETQSSGNGGDSK